MKTCLVCPRAVVSKRKDALYCKDPACRRKAYEQRKEQAAQGPPADSGNKASVVVTFPDGKRWLLELTPLQATDPAQIPSLAQVVAAIPAISSRSVPATPVITEAILPPPINTPAISSEQINSAAVAPETTLVRHQADDAAAVGTALTNKSAQQKELRRVELFFVDHKGRKLAFRDAVRRRTAGDWAVRYYAKAQVGLGVDEGHGLGGTPGRWRDIYPHQQPTEFGFDSDLAVLVMDDSENRAFAADEDLLTQALGADWRRRIREETKDRAARLR